VTHGEKLKLLIGLLVKGGQFQVKDASDAQLCLESASEIIAAVAEFTRQTEPNATKTLAHLGEVETELDLLASAIEEGEL